MALKSVLLLGLVLQIWALKTPEKLAAQVEVGASDQTDPLKTWMKSLQFHLPDSENSSTEEGSTSYFKYHDMVCTSLQFDRIHSDTFSSMGDPVLELVVDGVSITCTGQFSAMGTVSWLLVGGGSWEAQLSNQNGASFEILFSRENTYPLLQDLSSIKCQIAFHADVEIKGGLAITATNKMQKILSPFVNTFVQYQIQKKACAAFQDLLEVKAPPYLNHVNQLFFGRAAPEARRLDETGTGTPTPSPGSPNGTVPNSSDDSSANSSTAPVDKHEDPRLVDWMQSGLLQWSNWFYTKVLPPEVARELAKAAGPEFLTLDLDELPVPVPGFQAEVDQHGALGLVMEVKVAPMEIQMKGIEGVQAYGVEAVSPSQLRFALNMGTDESPVTTMAMKLGINLEAKDSTTSQAAASLAEEISFLVAVKKPSISAQMKVPLGADKVESRYTVAQWAVDPLNCGRSLLTETPTLEELNISFEGLSKPLSYTANTEGQLEQDLSDFFNAGVTIFNDLFETHLPGAIARIATSREGLDIANGLLKKQASPTQCINAIDAQDKIKGQYPAIYSDWPRALDGQMHTYVNRMIQGLLSTNETKAPSGWLEMPPVNAGTLTNIHLKGLKATGTHQIGNLKLFVTDPKSPETISFDMETSCPSEEKPYSATVVMNVEGTLDETGEALVEVQVPCGVLQTTLNLSVDTLEAATMLVPPSLFCTLLSPFKTLEVANLTTVHGGPGKVYVTLGSGTRHDVIEELCGKFPRLCGLMGRIAHTMANKENATIILSYMHQEAVGFCDKMIKANGRRLAEADSEGPRDALDVPYQEFSFGIVNLWLGILSCFIAAGLWVWTIKWREGKELQGGNLALGMHIVRSYGVAFAYVIALLMCLSVCLRDVACNHLAYASVDLRNLYKPSDKTLDTQSLAVFTYWGLAYQFKEANLLLSFEWVLNGLGATIGIFVIFATTFWVLKIPYTVQHIILRVGLFFARRPWQESATLGLSALAMTSDLALPVDVEGQMRMNMWSGPVLAIFSTLFLTAAGVCMLVTLPLKSTETQEEEGKNRMVLVDLVLCSGIILGMFIWFFFAFVEVGFRGMAATVLETNSFAGMQLGNTNAIAKLSILLVFVLAPFFQACLVMARVMGLKLMAPDVHRVVEEIFMSLNSLDIFALAFFVGFLTGVDGFASGFVNTKFAPLCQATEYVAGLPCLGVDPKPVPFGSIGLAIGSACTIGLYIRSSVEFHGLVSKPVRRRDVESEGQTAAVELQ